MHYKALPHSEYEFSLPYPTQQDSTIPNQTINMNPCLALPNFAKQHHTTHHQTLQKY